MRSWLILVCLALLSANPILAEGPPLSGKKIVGYFAEWGVYQRDYHVSEIPAAKLNVINYAFANLTATGDVVLYDSYAAVEKIYPGDTSDQPLRGSFNQLRKLKRKYPHLAVLISVGGWTLSTNFSDVARTSQGRAHFAKSAVAFMKKYGFDGVDIDWEFPGGGGLSPGRPEDKHNFTLLLRTLRTELDTLGELKQRHYYLTIAAPAGTTQISNLEPALIAKHCDWINVMTYDMHGVWENATNHHAPLYSDDHLSVDSAVRAYREGGVPARKLVVGIPFYGRAWKNVTNRNNGLFQPASGAPMGTWEEGMFDYWDLVAKNSAAPGIWKKFQDSERIGAYIHAPTVENGVFVTFDDPKSIAEKMRFVRKNQLGGAMLWELSGDTPKGVLLNAIYSGLVPQ